MLNSTKEYLQALRTGNYLLFLEWPRFIVHHYKKATLSDQSADELVDLMIFEWLNNDYCVEDAKLIALLTKLNDIEPKPLSGELDYALITVSVAVFQCMIYQSTNLQHTILCKEGKNRKEVLDFMGANSINISLLEPSLKIQQSQFAQWVELTTTSQVDKALEKIKPLLNLRQTVRRYLDVLEKPTSVKDELRVTRISVLHRLNNFLYEQTKITQPVRQEIDSYVSKIWDLAPQKFEEGFLMELTSMPLLKTTWRFLTDLGISFFQLLETPAVEVALSEPKSDLKSKI